MKLNIIKQNKKDKKEKEEKKAKEAPKVEEAPKVDTSNLLNIENLKNILGNSEDIKYRDILINNNTALPAIIICVDGLVNAADISEYVIKPLIENNEMDKAQNLEDVIKLVQNGALYFVSQTTTNDLKKAVDDLMSGRLYTFI